MMTASPYSMADILSIAKIHPFYTSDVTYPPDAETIQAAIKLASTTPTEVDWKAQPYLWRSHLYRVIERLVNDTNPLNTFRHSVYTSTTGGGTGSKPLLFATDVHENRRHRAYFGRFLRTMGLVSDKDWVVTTHTGGELYRSLDLTLEILENAGASVLAAGQHMTAADVIQLIVNYHVNVLSCESSQMIQIVHFISTLPKEHRDNVKLDKIIYTSEGLTPSQRSQIREVLGPIKICSILGSAEAGPYAVGCPHLTGSVTSMYEDFIFDTRLTRIEILPPSFSENDDNPKTLEQGQQGVIAQTSLTRLRNPLVRYITGDVGSLHPLPEASRSQIPEADWEHLRVLRFQGRDRRFSFEWDGNYFEFDKLNTMMSDSQSRVLQWQIVLDRMEPSNEGSLEIRILYAHTDTTSKQAFLEQIETFFHVFQGNCHRFKLVFVDHLSEFERSSTGRKVIKFVNKYN